MRANLGVLAARSIEPAEGGQKKSFELNNRMSFQEDASPQPPRSTASHTNIRLADSVSAVTLATRDEPGKEQRD